MVLNTDSRVLDNSNIFFKISITVKEASCRSNRCESFILIFDTFIVMIPINFKLGERCCLQESNNFVIVALWGNWSDYIRAILRHHAVLNDDIDVGEPKGFFILSN